MAAEGSPQALSVSLQSLAVTLIGYESNAQFVNPLTLLWNRVVDDSWICQMGAQIGVTNSSFTYTNGVQVEASDGDVTFRQRGHSLMPKDILITELARRYVDAFGAEDWIALSVEFVGGIDHSDGSDLAKWHSLSDRIAIEGIQPRLGTSAFYALENQRLRVEISLNPHSEPHELNSFAWLNRDLTSDTKQPQTDLRSALNGWEADWEKVTKATKLLLTMVVGTGSSQ